MNIIKLREKEYYKSWLLGGKKDYFYHNNKPYTGTVHVFDDMASIKSNNDMLYAVTFSKGLLHNLNGPACKANLAIVIDSYWIEGLEIIEHEFDIEVKKYLLLQAFKKIKNII